METLVLANSKKAQYFYNRSLINKGEKITDFYKKPSSNKIYAYLDCVKFMEELNGYNGHITGGSMNCFSYCFNYKDENNKEHLIYLTKDSIYNILL